MIHFFFPFRTVRAVVLSGAAPVVAAAGAAVTEAVAGVEPTVLRPAAAGAQEAAHREVTVEAGATPPPATAGGAVADRETGAPAIERMGVNLDLGPGLCQGHGQGHQLGAEHQRAQDRQQFVGPGGADPCHR